MAYSKPWQSYRKQLETLMDRGLLVTDRPRALNYLERIGYYWLSGYWHPFRERRGDRFRPGSTFQAAVDLYVFDKKLRLLTIDALERIEVALRVSLSHTLGRIPPFAHLDPALMHHDFSTTLDKDHCLTSHHRWIDKQAKLICRSKEDFVRHNRNITAGRCRYGLPVRSGSSVRCPNCSAGFGRRNRMKSPHATVYATVESSPPGCAA